MIEAQSMLDIAKIAFGRTGHIVKMFPDQCSGDLSPELYAARQQLANTPASALEEIERLKATIEPVRSWYDGDGEVTDVAGMLALAIADLQEDRAAVLKLAAHVRNLEALADTLRGRIDAGVAVWKRMRTELDEARAEAVEYLVAIRALVESAGADGPVDWIHKGSKDAWARLKLLVQVGSGEGGKT